LTTISSKAFYMIRRGFIVAVVTTLIGLILPGITAYKEGIFDEESMSKTMASKLPPEEQKDIEHYRVTKIAAKEKIQEIDSIFASTQILSNDQVSSLNAQLSIAHRLVSADPPVGFLPFYLSSGMLTWVFTLTPLAWLALVFLPRKKSFRSTPNQQSNGLRIAWVCWLSMDCLGALFRASKQWPKGDRFREL
jgi:hypothetical protein